MVETATIQIRPPQTEDEFQQLSDLTRELSTELEKYPLAADPEDMWERIMAAVVMAIARKDPVLVAVDAKKERCVGILLWLDAKNQLLPDKTLTALGTYVLPEYRQRRIANKLREVGLKIAKARGYRYVVGTVHPENMAGMKSLAGKGWRVAYQVVMQEV